MIVRYSVPRAIALLVSSLAFASPARSQLAPPPAERPPETAPPAEPDAAAPLASPPPASASPPVYRASRPAPPSNDSREDEEPTRAAGAETHDGLYLRLHLGAAYTSMSASTQGTDVSIAGTGGSFGIALGGALNSHLIVYGTFIDSVETSPTYKLTGPAMSDRSNGRLVGLVSVGGFGRAGVIGVGGGAAYYLESNLFFAGSLLGSRLFIDDRNGNSVGQSDWGFMFEGLFGKEWWVSDNWGLGVAGQVLLGAMRDHPPANNGSLPLWELATFSVLLSASYN